MADVIVLAAILGYCAFLIRRGYQNHKSGKHSGCAGCSGNCGSCGLKGMEAEIIECIRAGKEN